MEYARSRHVLLVRACLGCVSITERRRRFKLCLKAGNEDSAAVIQTKAFEKGVLALPGTVFLPNGRKTAYVRASFSLVGEDDVEEAVKRLREAVVESAGGCATDVV